MAVHGHDRVLDSLHHHLPSASLFLGPYSVGRWAAAEHLRWYYRVEDSDTLRVNKLDVEAAHTIKEFTLTRPAASDFKLVIVELYEASNAAQVALTVSLEDSRYARIIVIAQPGSALPGIVSRTTPYRFNYLHTEDVAKVLIEKMNFSPDRAHNLAERSGGQVAQALRVANSEEQLRVVREALHALRTHDEDALGALASRWTDEHTGWLVQWCNETISGQWRVFDHEDYIAGRALPLKILMATRPRVRPRLVVRSQLMNVLRGE